MKLIILSVFYIFFPYIILILTEKYSFLKKIGPIVLCFIIGIILSFSGILPEGSEKTQDMFISATVLIALPMLLFSTNIKSWKAIAGKTLVSMICGIVSLILIVAIGYLIWQNDISDAHKVGGMMIGLYTGGTPNLVALQSALSVEPAQYLMVNTYDLFFGAIYLFSIMSFGKLLLKRIMPAFKYNSGTYTASDEVKVEGLEDNPFVKKEVKNHFITLGISLLIAGLSVGISFLITGKITMLVVILSLTTLSLLAGLIKKVSEIKSSFNLGMYFILIFSLVLASMVKPELLKNLSYDLFFYIGFTIFGTLTLHIILSIIFKVDRDTTLVTSTALICSPPFVPMIAGSLKNKEVILPGITVGIIGYAVGNYLGVLVAFLLKNYL